MTDEIFTRYLAETLVYDPEEAGDKPVRERPVAQEGKPNETPSMFADNDALTLELDRRLATAPLRDMMSVRLAGDATFDFLWRLCEGTPVARALLSDLAQRSLYKRVVEAPVVGFSDAQQINILEIMKDPDKRVDFESRVSSALSRGLLREIQSHPDSRESLVKLVPLEIVERISAESAPFVVDLPTRGWMAEGDSPRFVEDSKRRYYGVTSRTARESDLWNAIIGPMMRRIAYFRVFAHPEIHTLVGAYMTPDLILAELDTVSELHGVQF
jgi:hypothetical protein